MTQEQELIERLRRWGRDWPSNATQDRANKAVIADTCAGLEAEIYALRAQLEKAREVKALVWDGDFAHTPLGAYYHIEQGNEHALVLRLHMGSAIFGIAVSYDIPELERAAQADYQRRYNAMSQEGE